MIVRIIVVVIVMVIVWVVVVIVVWIVVPWVVAHSPVPVVPRVARIAP